MTEPVVGLFIAALGIAVATNSDADGIGKGRLLEGLLRLAGRMGLNLAGG